MCPHPAERPWRRDPGPLADAGYDVLIIGGGINGAGIARDLALRGVRVLLVDQGDFGSGTSSASTKLVHGGLRYLENLDFRLVFEACRERRTLQRIAPHLVTPLPFLIPVYRDDPRPLWLVRAGMLLYDLLALFRNTRNHSILSRGEALQREPALRPAGLTGAALYWDCRMDDARLCLENVIAARSAGAEVCNYLAVTALRQENGRLCGARLHDREQDREWEVRARLVINASGPWLDRVCALAGDTAPKLRPTRGSHILVPRINRGDEALYLTAGRDERLFFVIPWGQASLIGTTDTDFTAAPDSVSVTPEDIDYLLAESARHLQAEAPQRSDILASFSGLRPLIRAEAQRESRVSREHRIFEHASGLISVGGGKYTTYRAVAAEVADLACRRLGHDPGPAPTAKRPLPGGATGRFASFCTRQREPLARRLGLTAPQADELLGRYGSRIELLQDLLDADPALTEPLSQQPLLLRGEVLFAARYEFARTPEDILRRRTPLALSHGRGLQQLEAVSALLARELHCDENRLNYWLRAYRQHHEQPMAAYPSEELQ